MKKVISVIMVLVMYLALFTGCGDEQTTTNGTSTTSSEDSQSTNNGSDVGEVVITFATSVYVEEPHQKAIDALIEAYNAKNNGVKIEVYGAGYADFWDNVTVEIMGGNEADILQVYPENVVSYNSLRAEGVFEDLSQYIGDSDYESTLAGQDMCTFDGETLALSNYAWGTTGFFYRKSILEEAGVDPDSINTWEDFYAASQKIADAGKIPMGIVDSSHAFVVSEWSRIMARSISGGLYFPDGESGPYVSDRLQVNAPANVWAAQEWQRYFLTDGLGKSSPDKKDAREYFWNGLAAFNHDGPWFIGMTAEHDPALMDDIGLIPIFDIEYEGKTYKPAPTMYPLVTCLSQKLNISKKHGISWLG